MTCIVKTPRNSLKLENNSPDNNYSSYKTVPVRKEFTDRNNNTICLITEQSYVKISTTNNINKINPSISPTNEIGNINNYTSFDKEYLSGAIIENILTNGIYIFFYA